MGNKGTGGIEVIATILAIVGALAGLFYGDEGLLYCHAEENARRWAQSPSATAECIDERCTVTIPVIAPGFKVDLTCSCERGGGCIEGWQK